MAYIYIYGNIRSSGKRRWGNQKENGRKINGQEEEEESSVRKKYVMGKVQEKRKKQKRTI